ncbi:2-oxo-4-hydroxy-4-carboxy-5-ureidoimidazoline decarboxylase [Takifugu rubripes]|uniref:2-oxo-4-hydroxy-4-carboxy-5-ureidoimidazoline decarboxylase n=1 Tax=Takifugu rubripes TaxID=31033 RepID=H2SNG7_TAKRU|nr:putative 2-oxo-4-hydroxy-4-carboxy-5-ureidoimidazoline decarboxylase [Takifugu rubripes]|eukprot:XP_003967981.1 PREDICTED: putative 2-oxo-4-hydroxy-4-carboxy-5-ureidoimidazoline decarboxylase [Takifugu rubripes]
MDIRAVNDLSFEEFVNIFGNLVEKCPIVAATVWSERPFGSFTALEKAIHDFIDHLPQSGKEGLLRCHPDLAGRDLQRGTLTQESRVEQVAAGLDALGSEEASRMERLNDEYKQRFGFPFVICARMNDKATILHQMTERCQNEPALETLRGIEEVKKISSLRLHSIILVDTPRL